MAYTATVTMYKQTGFNLTDVPGSTSALTSAKSKARSPINIRQIRLLSFIDVETWNDDSTFLPEDADYCKVSRADSGYGNMYFFVTSAVWLNDGVIRYSLTFDSVGTLLLNNLLKTSIMSGIVERKHVTDDSTKWYNIPEGFNNSAPLKKSIVEINSNPNDLWLELIISSVNLADIPLMAASFTSADGGFSTPALKPVTGSTEMTCVVLGGQGGVHGFKIPMSGKLAYMSSVFNSGDPRFSFSVDTVDADGNVTASETFNIAQTLRGLGLSNVITSAYSIPLNFISPQMHSDGYFQRLDTTSQDFATSVSIVASDTTMNRKARYAYRRFTLISCSSGNSEMYQAWELGDGSPNSNITISMVCDPTPGGGLIAQPSWIKFLNSSSVFADIMYRAVRSGIWNALTLSMEGGAVLLAKADNAIAQSNIDNQRNQINASWELQKAQMSNAFSSNMLSRNILEQQGISTQANYANAQYNATAQNMMMNNAFDVKSATGITSLVGSAVETGISIGTAGGSGAAGSSASGAAAGAMPGVVSGVINATGNQYINSYNTQMGNNLYNKNMETMNTNFNVARDTYNLQMNNLKGAQVDMLNAQQTYNNASNKTATIGNDLQSQANALSLRKSYLSQPSYISEATTGIGANFVGKYILIVEDFDTVDRTAFDLFLNAYGYNVNEQYTSANYDNVFNSRTKFNYVRMSDCFVKTPYTHSINSDVKARLLAGIRVWYKTPDVNDLTSVNSVK